MWAAAAGGGGDPSCPDSGADLCALPITPLHA